MLFSVKAYDAACFHDLVTFSDILICTAFITCKSNFFPKSCHLRLHIWICYVHNNNNNNNTNNNNNDDDFILRR